jgi:hypothetical protein
VSNHTPGPWEAGEGNLSGGYIGVFQQNGSRVICRVSPIDRVDEEDGPNAFLIAAAPDLLKACKAVVKDWQALHITEKDAEAGSPAALVYAAIAKAEGKP